MCHNPSAEIERYLHPYFLVLCTTSIIQYTFSYKRYLRKKKLLKGEEVTGEWRKIAW